MSELQSGDKRAAFLGMIVTTVLLFVVAFTISKLTSASFAGDPAHAESSK